MSKAVLSIVSTEQKEPTSCSDCHSFAFDGDVEALFGKKKKCCKKYKKKGRACKSCPKVFA